MGQVQVLPSAKREGTKEEEVQLCVRNLSRAYRNADGSLAKLVRMPNLLVASGTLAVIRGKSGAGKTTLLNLFSGIDVVTDGSVRWGDVELSGKSGQLLDRWRRDACGLIFQDFNLIPNIGAIDNVLLPVYFGAWSVRAMDARARDLLDRFGISADGRMTLTYSRGEQQRIAICRALIFDPPVIVADEPTASLDSANTQAIAEHLSQLAKTHGKTILVATHDSAIVERADLVIDLDLGGVQQ